MHRWFKAEEWECKCGCGLDSLSIHTKNKLDRAREFAGTPFTLTSASRCAVYNREVGGVPDSAHTPNVVGVSYAVDIACTESVYRYRIVDRLLQVGFRRIGIGKNFIHVDDSPFKTSDLIWLYEEEE